MIEQQTIEEIKLLLDRESYEEAIAFLEECLEKKSEELTYYWYLGLVYLLQENEELAQEIWLSLFLQGSLEEVEQWTLELTEFLEVKVEENIAERKLGNAKVIYESIFVINPGYENPELLNSLIESLFYLALGLIDENNRREAIDVYREILKLHPEHTLTWYSLATNYYHLEQYNEAEGSIKRAIELDELSADNYHILGLILEKKEQYSSAIEAYQKSIKLSPKFLDTYADLASIYLQQNQADKAIEIYKISLNVASIGFRASIFDKIGKAYEALENQSSAVLYFAYSAYVAQKHQEAIYYFEKFIISRTDKLDVYLKLCFCYIQTDQTLLAITLIENALKLFPKNLQLERLNQSILPIIYKDIEEIKFYRGRFSRLLEKLISDIELNTQQDQQDAFDSFQTGTNFYLGYQGENDLKIQKKYSYYVSLIINKIRSQWCQPLCISQDVGQRKIRVGYLSLNLQSLGALYLNWIKYRDQSKFEIYVYDISGNNESIKHERFKFREEFKIYSDDMKFISGGLDDCCAHVMNDKLDILIIPEIGLDHKTVILAVMRLAPIQCTTWGHPMTSGSSNIDYFLSSDLMEPENAEEHYSEKLVRLPNLGFCIDHPILPSLSKRRSDFQLRENSIVYLCCQALFKYLPQHDYIFPSVAQQNKLAQFVFIDSFLGPVITNSFKQRIDRAFAKLDLNYEDYCVFLKTVSLEDYLMLNQLADIFLDSFGWSGGITTKDAIACSLPIVTYPGKMMRARQSYGMLQMIGVTETIAKTEEEYIEIAVRLGLSHEWRQAVRGKMEENKHRLFNDKECIKSLESFFQETITKKLELT
jgi:predicted O-linked N-acetylglucosamine transferase (SPINDLY family)